MWQAVTIHRMMESSGTRRAVSLRDAAQEERSAFIFTGHIPEDLDPQLTAL